MYDKEEISLSRFTELLNEDAHKFQANHPDARIEKLKQIIADYRKGRVAAWENQLVTDLDEALSNTQTK